MRILWLSHIGELGGATLALAEAVSALVGLGHEVDVVLPEEGRLRANLTGAQSILIHHSNPWIAKVSPPFADRVRHLAFNCGRAVPALASRVASRAPDVVVTNTLASPVGALLARRMGKPHVWYLHEFGDLDHGYRFVWGKDLSLLVMRWLSNLVLVNSEALRQHFSKWLGDRLIRVVRYSVEVDVPHSVERRHQPPLRLVQVATRSAAKGQIDAVRATGSLKERGIDVELELIGGYEPDYDQLLDQEIGRLSLHDKIRMVDFDPQRLCRAATADVALVCSPCEAFGRFTIEAMKLGKPVVGAAGGATPELVRDGENGFLYPPGRADELADRIERFARRPSLISELGNRGLVWANANFSQKRYGADLEQALQEAIDRG